MSLYDELIGLVPEHILGDSGEVFYSGRSSFDQPSSSIYVLGYNPGSSPESLPDWTIGYDLELARGEDRRNWCGYVDDSWRGLEPGTATFQRRVRYLYEQCGLDPQMVPASNVIFVRSSSVAALDPARVEDLLRDTWEVHERAIKALRVRVVVCFGQHSGWWVRKQMGAVGPPVDTFTEDNGRSWTSTTHVGRDGVRVVTLTHPSRSNWTNPKTDPTVLVARAIAS